MANRLYPLCNKLGDYMSTLDMIECQITELENLMHQESNPEVLENISKAWISAKLAKLAVLEKIYQEVA